MPSLSDTNMRQMGTFGARPDFLAKRGSTGMRQPGLTTGGELLAGKGRFPNKTEV
jgi:hypothetical protein